MAKSKSFAVLCANARKINLVRLEKFLNDNGLHWAYCLRHNVVLLYIDKKAPEQIHLFFEMYDITYFDVFDTRETALAYIIGNCYAKSNVRMS